MKVIFVKTDVFIVQIMIQVYLSRLEDDADLMLPLASFFQSAAELSNEKKRCFCIFEDSGFNSVLRAILLTVPHTAWL